LEENKLAKKPELKAVNLSDIQTDKEITEVLEINNIIP